MDNTTTNIESQKLIHCKVVNKMRKTTERFIEIEHFKLWAYMMHHKHSLNIRDSSLWLWMKEEDYEVRKEIYSRASETLAVTKLGVFLFDEVNGFSNIIHRFCLSHEAEGVKDILLSHLAPDLINLGNYEINIIKGYCIRNELKDVDKLIIGLSDKDERLWYRER